MEFVILLNQAMCCKYNLTFQQGVQLEFLGKLSTWATSIVYEKEIYYNITFEKISEELPIVFSSSNKAYRAFLELKKKGFIEQVKVGRTQHNYVRLSAKGKRVLRFDKNNEPHQGSTNLTTRFDKNNEPQKTAVSVAVTESVVQGSTNTSTYHNQLTNISERDARAWDFLKDKKTYEMEVWEMQNKTQIENIEKFKSDFNDTVDVEQLVYDGKVLLARLSKYTRNWITNSSRFKVLKSETPSVRRKRIG
ncbi:conserved protein of unknown function [Tenacibaculum sp. 190524A02b]|uniref:hypothetical protein n=1 Tax=Tenacibaculum vairaonense TaxID=3137860 RepID=UPI0032B25EC2